VDCCFTHYASLVISLLACADGSDQQHHQGSSLSWEVSLEIWAKGAFLGNNREIMNKMLYFCCQEICRYLSSSQQWVGGWHSSHWSVESVYYLGCREWTSSPNMLFIDLPLPANLIFGKIALRKTWSIHCNITNFLIWKSLLLGHMLCSKSYHMSQSKSSIETIIQ